MKFLTVVAALASVAYAQYCPITNGACDTSKVPSAARTGELTRQYLQDGFSCSGTVVVDNECQFTVKNFQVVSPGSEQLKWYGAEVLNSSKGGNLLSNEAVAQTGSPADIVVKTDHNPFCRASLIEHVGSISLMDEKWRVICVADIGAPTGASSSSGSSSGASSGASTGASTGATTGSSSSSSSGASNGSTVAGNSTSSTIKTSNNNSGAGARYAVPSALYAGLVSLFLYLRH